MFTGLDITVLDQEIDYLRIEISASCDGFSGETSIESADFTEIRRCADAIDGFPSQIPDERTHVFGEKNSGLHSDFSDQYSYGSGYCRLHFFTVGNLGHAIVSVEIDDNNGNSAAFRIPLNAGDLDRFVKKLRAMEAKGNALIESLLRDLRP